MLLPRVARLVLLSRSLKLRPIGFRSIIQSALPHQMAAPADGAGAFTAEPLPESLKASMLSVIQKAVDNVHSAGGPFGAAIVKLVEGGALEVVSLEGNAVTKCNDPTAHAEVQAIRAACAKLGTFDLRGHVLVTSCYPCPMCCGASMWARVDKVYYAATAQDAADGGFDDRVFYEEIAKPDADRRAPLLPVDGLTKEQRIAPFTAWKENVARTDY